MSNKRRRELITKRDIVDLVTLSKQFAAENYVTNSEASDYLIQEILHLEIDLYDLYMPFLPTSIRDNESNEVYQGMWEYVVNSNWWQHDETRSSSDWDSQFHPSKIGILKSDAQTFFSQESETDSEQAPYLNPSHPRYAPKLAAAIAAWIAIDDERMMLRKSPKQALVSWLLQNAEKYSLLDENGKPNETGIEECAKVANWQRKGGAPKTPTK
ncbi:MAG: hypothetical protein N0E48_28625 [Candidatus Thiodiazotropha endolucinida]|nr:hypothetical protein [Candidatus Thiodiazotropha taylori]MCW4347282.1 hypothetical protein [Candidatus Thiodiazotropha endolucinida]